MIEARRMLMSNGSLPPMYKRVDYIEAKQSAYMVMDYIPQQSDEIFVRFMPCRIDGNLHCLFSAGNGTYQLIALGYGTNEDLFYCKYFASGGAKTLQSKNALNIWTTMRVTSSGQFTSNNTSVTSPYEYSLDGNNTKLNIFRRANASNHYIGKLSTFRITNNGMVKLDLIPCIKTSTGIAGVYDTASRTFYTSSSSEQFSYS